MQKVVISIGTGPSQRPLIESARRHGFVVLGVDRTPDHDLVDEAITCSTYEPDRVLQAVKQHRLRNDVVAVLARTSGPALKTAAKLTTQLGVSGVHEFLADISISKSLLRSACQERDIATPKGAAYSSCPALDFDRAWVVKPDQPLYGKKNVYLVEDEERLATVFQECAEESVNARVEIQQYHDGLDVGLVLLVKKGEILWHGFYQELVDLVRGQFHGGGVKGPWHGGAEEKMLKAAKRLLSGFNPSGFVFFSFRVSFDQKQVNLYEVNPGLCGDSLADKLMPAIWGGGDSFFDLDITVHTDLSFDLPCETGKLGYVI